MGMTGEQAYVLAKKLIEAGGGGGGTIDAYTKTQTDNLLIQKVDKEVGKGLFSGSYNDLSDTPTIPTKTSELQNDSGYQTAEQVNSTVNELLAEELLKLNVKGTTYFEFNELLSGDVFDISNNTSDVIVVGRNMAKSEIADSTIGDLTVKAESDGSITLNGTTSGTSIDLWNDVDNPRLLPKGRYYLKVYKSGSATSGGTISIRNGSDYIVKQFTYGVTEYKTFELKTDTPMTRIQYYFSSGITFDSYNLKAYLGRDYFDDYEPYTELIGKNKAIENGIVYMSDFNTFDITYNPNYIKKNSSLQGKKLMLFGDSITAMWYTYPNWLMKYSGMKLVGTFAVSGATLCNNSSTVMNGNPTGSSNNTVPNQVQKLLNNASNYDEPDVILFACGTNDLYLNKDTDIEKYFTNGTSEYIDIDTLDLTEFPSATRWIVEKLYSLYPNAQIIYGNPIQRAEIASGSQIAKLNGIVNLMTNVCNRLSIPMINAFGESGINARYEINGQNGKYLQDGLHPSYIGGKKLGKFYANKIEQILS